MAESESWSFLSVPRLMSDATMRGKGEEEGVYARVFAPGLASRRSTNSRRRRLATGEDLSVVGNG